MKQSDLGKDNIITLTLRMSLPTCLAQAVMVLYSIVDRMFIGHIEGVGTTALAGVGVAAPITTFIASFAVLVGMGGSPIMAMRAGHGEPDKAEDVIYNGFILLIIFSAILTPLFLLIKVPMLRLFGASELTLPYADEYITWYLLGTPFALLSSGLNSYLINQGLTGKAMASVLIGAALNIVLDPIFIFTLGLGVKGGAIATVISQIASTLLTVAFLRGRNTSLRLRRKSWEGKLARHIATLGISPFIIIATDSLLLIFLNMTLQRYGGAELGDLLITAATIIQSCHMMVMNPLGGITGGSQGIISYNYGSGDGTRVKQAYLSVVTLAFLYTVLMTVLIRTVGPAFIGLFTTDEEIIAPTFHYLKLFELLIIPLSLQYTNVDVFTALGQVRLALPMSLIRKFLFFICLLILPPLFGAGSAFLSEPVCDGIASVISTTCMAIFLPRIIKERAEKGLNI